MRRTNKYSRPLLALLLLAAGLAGAMRPHSVAAQNSGTTGPLNWNYDPSTKTLSITGSGNMPDFSFNLPWLAFQPQTVTIGAGVTSVGKNAFFGRTALKSVTLPAGLQTIGEWAFKGCWSLTNLILPKSVTSISGLAFLNCTGLKEVTVFWDTPLTISADAFQGIELNKVKLYVPAGKTGAYQAANVWKDFDVQEIPGGNLSGGLHWQYIPSSHTLTITGSGNMPDFNFPINQPWGAFRGQIENVTIGAGVKSVGENAFASCKKLTAVTLPSSVTTIGVYAFSNCKALTGITIPSGVKTIKESAFYGCTALTSVTLPEGLTTIDGGVFTDCDALASIELPASLQTIDGIAFDAPALTEIKVKAGNAHLEAAEGVLYNKGKKTLLRYPRKKPGASFAVPAGVTTIKEYAFTNCTALTSVTLPADAKLTTIEQGAFYACEMLTSITLPEGLQTIGGNVFNTCEKLPSITIPKSVTTIGDGAFAYCTALKDVTVFWNTPLTIPPGVFGGITPPTGVTLHVPGGTGEAYQGDAVWGKFTIVELPWGDFDNGLHWAYDATTHSLTITNPTPGTPKSMPDFADQDNQPWKAYRGGIQKVTIGAGVNHVGAYAFTNCEKLTSVTLPAGLKEIEKNAFGGCETLTSINLPEGLKTIGEGAFTACFALSDLTIPKSVETIEENAFYQCGSLTHVTLPDDAQLTTIGKNAFFRCRSLTNLTIPKNVTAIGQSAFNECLALKSITIPNGVTAIADFAFQGCTALKDVTVAWETPIQPNSDAFKQLPLDKIRLHVPEGKIGAYKAANVWRDFIVMADRGDLAGGLKWQMDATYTLTIINPTPGSPKPMPDFNNWDEQPWESFRREIQAVTIEDGVSSVGETAFSGCNKMTHVTLPKSVTTIREGAFAGCNKMTHVTLPADGRLDTIGKEAFIRCSALTSISLPKSATTIERSAFSVCEALTSVTLPADGKLQTIGVNAFGGCVKLKSITIPNSVTTIELGAFSSCKELTSVTLPKSVTTIEDDAFQDCKALKDLTVAWTDTASIPKITLDVFQYTPPATVKLSDIRLHVPHGTVAAYQLEDVWKEFTIVEQPLPPTPTPEIPETPSTPPTPPVTGKKIGGITLSPSSFVLDGERTFRFSATISPSDAADKRLICTSSDESIVRVRVLSAEETRRGLRSATDPAVITYEGTVYGVGRATITVKSTDGSALRVTCPVDVRRLPTSTVDATPTRLYTADGQLHLTLPASATVRVYNVSGRLVRTFLAPAGDSSVALPEGIYVVRVGDHTEKIVVVK